MQWQANCPNWKNVQPGGGGLLGGSESPQSNSHIPTQFQNSSYISYRQYAEYELMTRFPFILIIIYGWTCVGYEMLIR